MQDNQAPWGPPQQPSSQDPGAQQGWQQGQPPPRQDQYGQQQQGGQPYQGQPQYGQQAAARPQEAYRDQGEMQPAAQPGHRGQRQPSGKQYSIRGAESFWYVLGCIAGGAAYFSKIPAKKAASEVMSELQLDGQGPSHGYSLKGAEGFWYVLMCLGFGAGYFAKVSVKKALWEVVSIVQAGPGSNAEALARALYR
jgi:hypothetical protein